MLNLKDLMPLRKFTKGDTLLKEALHGRKTTEDLLLGMKDLKKPMKDLNFLPIQ